MSFMDDVRLAARRLAKSPGFTSAAVVTLAIGIGANAALFAAVRAVLLRPLPLRDAEQLVVMWERDTARNLPVVEVSYGNYLDWRAAARSFESLAVVGSVNWDMLLEEQGDPTRVPAAGVSASFFDVLGVQPAYGRAFLSGDDARNAPRTVILGHGLWQQRFGGNPNVLGISVTLDGERFQVVGIMPPDFDYPTGVQIWTPVVPVITRAEEKWKVDALELVRVLYVIGRLKRDATPAQAAAELDPVARRLAPQWYTGTSEPVVSVTRLPDQIFGQTRPALLLLSGTVMLVLFVACANVSGLVLTRANSRGREVAVKRALGASRSRLAAEWLAETMWLAAAAGAASIGVALACSRVVSLVAPADVPRLGEMRVDLGAIAFALGLSIASALVCALPPALRATSSRLVDVLAEGARGSESRRTRRFRQALIVCEVAVALVLLIGAGLMVRSFAALRSLDLGFRSTNILTLDVEPLVDTHAEWRRSFDTILERVRTLPGVLAAGSIFIRPLAHGPIGLESGYLTEGQSIEREEWRTNPGLNYQTVTPGYFEAMGIALRRGRYLSASDTAATPSVVVLGERTARRIWPGQDPLGKRIFITAAATAEERRRAPVWQTVVGVVSDVRYRGLDDLRLDVYMSAAQSPQRAPHLVVRTSGDPVSSAAAVRAAIRAAAPRSVIDGVRTMEGIVDDAMAPWRFSMTLFVALAGIAVVLAAVGLFAVIALTVAQRTREIAVRVAVGATASNVLTMVMWQAAKVAAAGLTLGGIAALSLARLMSGLLFQVAPSDPATFAAVSGGLFAVTLGASYLAARRVTAIDPIRALRAD